jgi:hypothetical protein
MAEATEYIHSRGKNRRVTTISSNVKVTDIAQKHELALLAPIRFNDRVKLQNPSKEYNFKCNGDIETGPLTGLNVEWTASFDRPLEQLLYPSLQRFDLKINEEKERRKQYQSLHGHYDRNDHRSPSRGNLLLSESKQPLCLPVESSNSGQPVDSEKLFLFSPSWKASVTMGNRSTSPGAFSPAKQSASIDKLGEDCLRTQLKEKYFENVKRQEDREQMLMRENNTSHFGFPSFKRKDALKESHGSTLLPEILVYGDTLS